MPILPGNTRPTGRRSRQPRGARCAAPTPALEQRMIAIIDQARKAGDSIGGAFQVVARGVPPGLGSHTQWDLRLNARLAAALCSIQSIKAVSIGDGVEAATASGSEFHDPIHYDEAERRFFRSSNHAGGIEGGISNGEEIRIRAYVKPLSTLPRPLHSVDLNSKEAFSGAGGEDRCLGHRGGRRGRRGDDRHHPGRNLPGEVRRRLDAGSAPQPIRDICSNSAIIEALNGPQGASLRGIPPPSAESGQWSPAYPGGGWRPTARSPAWRGSAGERARRDGRCTRYLTACASRTRRSLAPGDQRRRPHQSQGRRWRGAGDTAPGCSVAA